jgi:lysophospholipase L1-like esterase
MVTTYSPDYLLVLLGFNDLGWGISDAEGTFESMEIFISEARAAKPDIKFALGNIPQRSFIGDHSDLPSKTDVYNQIIAAAIPRLSMYFLHFTLQPLALKWERSHGPWFKSQQVSNTMEYFHRVLS